jgi:hypothetical protein
MSQGSGDDNHRRQSGGDLGCCGGGTAPEALDVELEDRGVMDEAIVGGDGRCGVGENPTPFFKGSRFGVDSQGHALQVDDSVASHNIHTDLFDILRLCEDF